MNSAIERLLNLKVGDMMAKSVVQISAQETMAKAAEMLRQYDVSGAPVVEENGRCVGVISGSDFVIRERERKGELDSGAGAAETVLVQDAPGEPYHFEEFATDRVEVHMSESVETITPNSTIMEAARAMCTEHIHRLVVLDDSGRPVGLVSSLDLVAALVKAVEE